MPPKSIVFLRVCGENEPNNRKGPDDRKPDPIFPNHTPERCRCGDFRTEVLRTLRLSHTAMVCRPRWWTLGRFLFRGAWCLCCARSPFPAGAGNSFPKALRVSLHCRQGRRPAQSGRDEKPMCLNRLGPSHERMCGAGKAGRAVSRYIAQPLDECCGMKENEGKRDMENSGNRTMAFPISEKLFRRIKRRLDRRDRLPDSVGQAVLHLGDQAFLDSRMDVCTVKRAAV